MEILNLTNDIKLFGLEVKTFPLGIGEVFEALAKNISDGYDRSYYGISQCVNGSIIYKAAAEERSEDQARKYHCQQFTIEKGAYQAIAIKDWRKKLNCIKDIFHEMMQDSRCDNTKPCIEWYKDNDEMFCMIKSKV